ncbi:hypothetical protein CI109_106185 [Kwoniella shandongensis]|uniref:Uncharacterized protein n=1 Tax=Kwoniella shandongensis TaxID=1734106 RepID=A0A5M6C3L7_9TREE|nr:uncharacterized protein CI109_003790 [Kwoniella shandongensis]KAA5527819.1 hypothetical protein CI109_003790 [Kwoniella shandongensis]
MSFDPCLSRSYFLRNRHRNSSSSSPPPEESSSVSPTAPTTRTHSRSGRESDPRKRGRSRSLGTVPHDHQVSTSSKTSSLRPRRTVSSSTSSAHNTDESSLPPPKKRPRLDGGRMDRSPSLTPLPEDKDECNNHGSDKHQMVYSGKIPLPKDNTRSDPSDDPDLRQLSPTLCNDEDPEKNREMTWGNILHHKQAINWAGDSDLSSMGSLDEDTEVEASSDEGKQLDQPPAIEQRGLALNDTPTIVPRNDRTSERPDTTHSPPSIVITNPTEPISHKKAHVPLRHTTVNPSIEPISKGSSTEVSVGVAISASPSKTAAIRWYFDDISLKLANEGIEQVISYGRKIETQPSSRNLPNSAGNDEHSLEIAAALNDQAGSSTAFPGDHTKELAATSSALMVSLGGTATHSTRPSTIEPRQAKLRPRTQPSLQRYH